MKSIFKDSALYTIYKVTIMFRDKCFGGQPKSREILEKWIESKGEMPREPMEEKEKVLDLEEETEQVWCGFRRNGHGIYIRDFQIEALLSQCGTTLGITVNTRGSKGIIQHGLHVGPRAIHFLDKPKADGFDDIAGHVMTPQGKRSILKRCDFVLHAELTFELKLLKYGPPKLKPAAEAKIPDKPKVREPKERGIQNKLSEKDILTMLHLGQENGLGSCRSMGGGKFDVIEFEKQ